jgi:YHS domain-containing protein
MKKEEYRDIVCNLRIEDFEQAKKVEYKGEVFYLCSEPCEREFKREPEFYLHKREVACATPESIAD